MAHAILDDAPRVHKLPAGVRPTTLVRPAMAPKSNLPLQALLVGALDEIDYGIVLLDAQGAVCHVNHLAHRELFHGVLAIEPSGLIAEAPECRDDLQAALLRAARGTRSLVELQHANGGRVTVAVLPMAGLNAPQAASSPVMLIAGKLQLCEPISLQMFARQFALSRAEQVVLLALAQGLKVADIASSRGLALSTVRSQIKDIRFKTRTKSVRELLAKLSALPPLVNSIKAFPEF